MNGVITQSSKGVINEGDVFGAYHAPSTELTPRV